MRTFGTTLATALCFVMISTAHAQNSDPTIQYLINAPLTLMDKAALEIQRKTERANNSTYYFNNRPAFMEVEALHTSLYVHSDRLIVASYVYPDKFEGGKDECVQMLRFAENVMGFRSDFENTSPNILRHGLTNLFSHYAYQPSDHPNEIGNRLLGIFTQQVAIVPNHGERQFCHSVGGGPIMMGEAK